VDGHHLPELVPALRAADPVRPSLVICRTVKGKGVSFMEGRADWHGRAPTAEQLAQALAELGGAARGEERP
jgi:transketolase